MKLSALAISCVLLLGGSVAVLAAGDPLSSWEDGAAKEKILGFVESVTTEGGASFVPEEERIAVFDIDGTLWSERPYYSDAQFAADRVKALSNEHPEWAKQLPFAPIVKGDYEVLNHIASADFVRMMAAARNGADNEEFHRVVQEWVDSVENPVKKRPQSKLTYQPMLELLSFMKDKGFKNYLVTGADEEYVRAISEQIYQVPREQVIGAGLAVSVKETDEGVTVTRLPEVGVDNNGPGKVVQIGEVVGRKPIFAAGNSDGDFYMMRWATTGAGPSMAVLVLHDDPDREFPASRPKKAGAGVDTLPNWVGISMKDDWSTVYPAD